MKISICNEIFQDIDFAETCKLIHKYGYHGVEIAPYTFAKDVRYISQNKRNEIKQIAKENNLKIVGLHWLLTTPEGLSITNPDETMLDETIEYFKALADFSNDIGANIMVLGSPKQRNIHADWDVEKAKKRAIFVLKKICYYAKEINPELILAFEPLSPKVTNFGSSIEEVLDLIKIINLPNFKLHIDANAMTYEEKDPIGLIETAGLENIKHVHLNEPNLLGPGMNNEKTICGKVITKLKQMGYKGWLSVETFDRNVSGEEIAEKSMNFIQNYI